MFYLPIEKTKAYPAVKAEQGGRMEWFHIYSGSVLVGRSALETGDPPMGVVSGEFEPADGYDPMRGRQYCGLFA
jgi:hypothetical protein